MAVGLDRPGSLPPVPGIKLAAVHCGIKADPAATDLSLIETIPGSSVAGVFSLSHFCAAPVTLCREHLADRAGVRYLLINSGNANAATGEAGLQAARQSCAAVAEAAGVDANQVLPFSTGVIAEPLPLEPIVRAIPELVVNVSADAWIAAAEGIMTTDTLPKACSRQLEVDGRRVTINGIAKGSGMIRPDMATMLAYVATDAVLSPAHAQTALERAVGHSFNSITVDGDTSTNDSCILIASGASQAVADTDQAFARALDELFVELAQAVIRDAEGATKFIEIEVNGAADEGDARSVAFTIAESPLVKTALFASDPNWGRFIMAIGRAPLRRIEVERIDLYLGSTRLLYRGLPDPDYEESRGQAEMSRPEIRIRVDLNLGDARACVWTSDLSYDYVKINAEYRS